MTRPELWHRLQDPVIGEPTDRLTAKKPVPLRFFAPGLNMATLDVIFSPESFYDIASFVRSSLCARRHLENDAVT